MEDDPDHLNIASKKGKVIIDHPSCNEIELTPEEALEAAERLAQEAALGGSKTRPGMTCPAAGSAAGPC